MIELHERPKQRRKWRGQGLVEYGLITALVALGVLVIVSTLGNAIVSMMCRVTLQLDPSVDTTICERLEVSCQGVSDGQTVSGQIVVSADVTDILPPDNVERVQFLVDGGWVQTENHPMYCMGGGNGPCSPFDTNQLSNGQHTIKAVATDEDGNVGTCEVTIRVAN